ncbi:cache domain-containing sensor histidine kinase [Paenibacillus thalictri]|uniref:Sensor histidine kinase n=1 Tax=Paenibacillus thalictri TaxID=2527873 RepID=A0A4V6MSI7_9BACL|nr:sensor histidine kinase [Paenibacillus thalictri]TBL80672.1 sensor histidine kinase [Paenibacillus thalictri]
MKAVSRPILRKLFRLLLLNDQSLAIKLFVFSALFIMIPMLVVGAISYQRSANVMEKEAQQYSLQIIEQVKAHIEYYVNDLEILMLKMVNHPDMIRFLHMQTQEEVQQSGIRAEIQQMLQNASYSRSDITAITITLDNIQTVDTIGVNGIEPVSELSDEYWYKSVPVNGDPILISRFVKYADRPEPVLSIVRRLVSPFTLEPIGMLILDVNYKRFQELAEKVTVGEDGSMIILDREGHYVYHPDLNMLGEMADFDQLDTLVHQQSGSLLTDQKDFVSYSHSFFLGWTLLTTRPYSDLMGGISYIGKTIFWTTAVALLTAYVLGAVFASGLIRRIRNLHSLMKRVQMGEFSSRLAVESQDEIGMLTHGFNEMVVRLKELLDEVYFSRLKETELSLNQKEIELKMLQSQINPHFLYNSLETIRGMALERDMDHIADMAFSLAKLLRFNIKETSKTVPLQSEISVCELYMRIQKYRFEEKVEYEIDIPDWALTQPIVRFSLQPIVENCVIHGIEPSADKTVIHITASREADDVFVVRISDTGPGIETERLEEIRREMSRKEARAASERIGVLNVHRRIQYLCGEQYGIRLHSIPGTGTTVDIRLPLQPA